RPHRTARHERGLVPGFGGFGQPLAQAGPDRRRVTFKLQCPSGIPFGRTAIHQKGRHNGKTLGKTLRNQQCASLYSTLFISSTTLQGFLFMMLTLDFWTNLVQQHGQETALEDADSQVSYAELSVAVNALAVALQSKDPIPGSRVALCAGQSLRSEEHTSELQSRE